LIHHKNGSRERRIEKKETLKCNNVGGYSAVCNAANVQW